MIKKDEKKISSSFEENIAYMDQVLPVKESFDIIKREMEIGGRKSFFYFIDGFVKDEAMLKLMDSFLSVTEEDMPEDAQAFSVKEVPYVEVEVLTDFDQVMRNVLSGTSCLFIEGYEGCLCIDCRTYPARSVDEPDKDKSLRGSRDGFVETIVFNTALMRRRIRDPHLVMEMTEAGQASRTDIAVCYMSDRVDRELLKNLKNRIESLQVGDLRMNQQSLAEALFKRKWFNPFPKFKYTERPDTAAACLLEGKVALVTGAGRGIGAAIAETLAREGAFVVVNYRGSGQAAQELAEKIGGVAMQCDVADFEACENMIKTMIETYGHLDILVNNAGITRDGLLMKMSEADFEAVLSTNLKGTFHTIRHASRYFLKQRYGRIVNISSVSGVMGNAGQANYSASKAGVIGLTKSVARELASRGITCNAVAPGFIETDMTDAMTESAKEAVQKQIPLGRCGNTKDVAELVTFLASDKAAYITGQVISVDGGMCM